MWVGGLLPCSTDLKFDCCVFFILEPEGYDFLLAGSYMGLSSGVWKEQHAEIVLS